MPLVPSEEILHRVRSEFLEMPGLKLTIGQAVRLWGIDHATCQALIDALTQTKFLLRTRDGAVVRRADSA